MIPGVYEILNAKRGFLDTTPFNHLAVFGLEGKKNYGSPTAVMKTLWLEEKGRQRIMIEGTNRPKIHYLDSKCWDFFDILGTGILKPNEIIDEYNILRRHYPYTFSPVYGIDPEYFKKHGTPRFRTWGTDIHMMEDREGLYKDLIQIAKGHLPKRFREENLESFTK